MCFLNLNLQSYSKFMKIWNFQPAGQPAGQPASQPAGRPASSMIENISSSNVEKHNAFQ